MIGGTEYRMPERPAAENDKTARHALMYRHFGPILELTMRWLLARPEARTKWQQKVRPAADALR